MPMNGDILGAEIVTAMDAVLASEPVASESQRASMWAAIGNAIVAHITANAVVSTTVAVVSVSGVTTGVATSGPGAGTGTGSVA